MTFVPKTWQNSPSTSTPLNATGLNDLETRVSDAFAAEATNLASVVQPGSARTLVYPSFTRLSTSAPMYSGTSTAGNSVFWPWVVNVKAIDSSTPAGKEYRMYESTDHDSQVGGNGGIFVRYSSSPTGPWTNAAGTVGARNSVYDPGGAGTVEVETPSVLYVPEDPNGRPWYLYFQNIGGLGIGPGEQSTWMVSSEDGLTGWVSENMYAPAISGVTSQFDIPDTTAFYGDGHTGYFSPMRFGQQFVAYHLLGGSDNAGYGMSWSLDGKRWLMDSNIIRYQQHLLKNWGSEVRMTFSLGGLVIWYGQPWRVGTLTDAASGSQVGARKVVMYPMGWDLRTILAPPTILLDPDALGGTQWESADVRSAMPFVDSDGTLYVYYQASQGFGVGRVDPAAEPNPVSGMKTVVFDAPVANDDFNATSGTILTAHSADLGGPWIRHPLTAVDMAISSAGRLRADVASTTSVHLMTAAPSSANYQVKATLHYFSSAASSYGVVGRFDSSALTGYAAIRNSSAGLWQILRFNAGTSTTLASSPVTTLSAGADYVMKFQMRGALLKIIVDGVTVLQVSDATPILSIGRGGVRINGSNSDTLGIHLEDFAITQE